MDNQKQLTRSLEDSKIAGICSGLAEYSGIDVLIIRIGFLLAYFFSGLGWIAYVIMWIAVPVKDPENKKSGRMALFIIISLIPMLIVLLPFIGSLLFII